MALIDQVKDICTRLAPGGWHNLLLHHGLNILAPSLQDELRNVLKVDRTLAGFEDFASSGVRGIEPGKPALSLLFHALANANVTMDAKGNPLQIYPTAAELETVMNYVYGSQPPSLQQLKELANGAPMAVVVFANEYRPAPDTVHKEQADMCFSRTGISRVGTAEPCTMHKVEGSYLLLQMTTTPFVSCLLDTPPTSPSNAKETPQLSALCACAKRTKPTIFGYPCTNCSTAPSALRV